jgi:hypothetical protein
LAEKNKKKDPTNTPTTQAKAFAHLSANREIFLGNARVTEFL